MTTEGDAAAAAPPGGTTSPVAAAMRRLLALGGVEAKSRFAYVAGARLHYLEAGAGEPLVLLQGASGGAANWYRVLGPLAAHFRVLALDLPGFGLSDPLNVEAPLGAGGAEVVSAWLGAAAIERCALVGTSLGGLLALRLAQREPGRVRRLVLLDAVGLGRELPLLVRCAGLPGLGRLLLRPTRSGTAWLFRRLLTSDRSRLDAAHQAALIDYLWSSARAGDARGMARAVRRFADPGGQREVLTDAELEALRVPVLVVWGERDRFVPLAHALRAAARIPGAELRILAGVGHSPNWEAPEAFLAAALAFTRS
ncbi:MAG: alpha/beta fold hydrolase [Gemmatimonadetes bacterium]|nr:alpha/beta fold hydrolase [Gemmatimonadota bacterium]